MSISDGSNPLQAYLVDAWQRWVLGLDVLRERGNTYFEHLSHQAPNVLTFKPVLICDGRKLPRPVNYLLVQILPEDGRQEDPTKPPVIVVDPRAGHGPGIGGMKQDSEIGVALAAGHPCYFIGFLPQPEPGQTIEDVCLAEAAFIEEVVRRHPDVEAKPIIIANCQAGWQIMMMAATHPDLAGPIMLAGSPLSYWAGHRGKNPLRYLGGILGGTWLTALAGDLGGGIFDGANLVANFESMNPANTYWKKIYNVYSKVDSEAQRFLDFETWWGSPVTLNAQEMQWIADNLFVGNKLTDGSLQTTDGTRIDLRNIKSPIIVFCSWGDDITPPPQALGWITDLYAEDRDIVAAGQTIVYAMHQNIGHLGIFVSGKVATKEHDEFVNCMDMIDLMPPGLYEAVITDVDDNTEHLDLIQGRYLFRLEGRRLDDIRSICGDANDDQRFATAARVSEINLGLYENFLAPLVRAATTEPMADAMRKCHPNRLRFAMFSDRNPLMQQVGQLAASTRAARQPVTADNPLLAVERAISSSISMYWDGYQQMRDLTTELAFLGVYGSPWLQAMVGLGAPSSADHRLGGRDLYRDAIAARQMARLEGRFDQGGAAAALVRSLIYIQLSEGSADERGFAALKAIRLAQPAHQRLTWPEAKELIRDQYLLLLADEERAIEAIPALLPETKKERRAVRDAIRRVATVHGELSPESARWLARIESLFGPEINEDAKSQVAHA
jgi:pimeloyl-ACP methyl ester carboxylesterase